MTKLNEDPGHSILDIISPEDLADLKNDVGQGILDMSKPYYEKLYNYYLDSGEMPVDIAKARTGDPDQWILDRVEQDYGAEVGGDNVQEDFERHDRYADREWSKQLSKDNPSAKKIAKRLGGDELTLHSDEDDKRHAGSSNDYFSHMASRKKVKEDGEPTYAEHEVWKVLIPANVWDGKYYDYRVVQIHLHKDSLPTEKDAVQYVLNNKQKVLDNIDKKYVRVGADRKRRLVPKPVEKNVFFGDTKPMSGGVRVSGVTKISTAKPENILGYKAKASSEGKAQMKEGYVKQLRKLLEAEVEQAESLIAAKSFSQELQDMVEKLGRLVNETLPAVSEQMRDAYGADVATGFENTVSGTLNGVMDSLKSSKQEVDNAVSTVSGGGMPEAGSDMDAYGADEAGDVAADADLDLDADVDLDLDTGDLGGDAGVEVDAGAVEEPLGRAKKESVQNLRKKIVEMSKKLAEAKKSKSLSKKETRKLHAKADKEGVEPAYIAARKKGK